MPRSHLTRMLGYRTPVPWRVTALLAAAAVLLSAGCAGGTVGSRSIINDRLGYSEAILRTGNQQMLLAVVKERYSERAELLAVASVTANVRIERRAAVEFGVGDSDDFAGNLVPLSGSVASEENPTISYVPVSSTRYTEALLSPLDIEMLARITMSASNPADSLRALVAVVNSLKNRDEDPRFARFVELAGNLLKHRDIYWVRDPGTEQLGLLIDRDYLSGDKLDELFDLLGLETPDQTLVHQVVPVFLSHDASEIGAIGIVPRTLYDLIEILAGAVVIPPSDQLDGSAPDYSMVSELSRKLKVHWSNEAPRTALVAVQHRGGWFYIDERDQRTKQFFRLLTILWSSAIGDGASIGTPVLTVPVSG